MYLMGWLDGRVYEQMGLGVLLRVRIEIYIYIYDNMIKKRECYCDSFMNGSGMDGCVGESACRRVSGLTLANGE